MDATSFGAPDLPVQLPTLVRSITNAAVTPIIALGTAMEKSDPRSKG
jgi:hypothetical protein